MSVPQRTSPFGVGLLPEFRDQAAQKQMLGEAHPRVRRHFERAHLDQPQAAAAAFGRKKLIDARIRRDAYCRWNR